jgi:hypothetical protein
METEGSLRVHNSPPLVPILSQTNPVQALTTDFFKIYSNIIPSQIKQTGHLRVRAVKIITKRHIRHFGISRAILLSQRKMHS